MIRSLREDASDEQRSLLHRFLHILWARLELFHLPRIFHKSLCFCLDARRGNFSQNWLIMLNFKYAERGELPSLFGCRLCRQPHRPGALGPEADTCRSVSRHIPSLMACVSLPAHSPPLYLSHYFLLFMWPNAVCWFEINWCLFWYSVLLYSGRLPWFTIFGENIKLAAFIGMIYPKKYVMLRIWFMHEFQKKLTWFEFYKN